MNKSIFKSTLSSDGIREIESITNYTTHRVNVLGRIADYFGYVIGGIICGFPIIFVVIAQIDKV